uniref:Uncharacterized protein n=1 Tax=Anguilla anguilla TaxID=7936 RepID=A0A0E9RXW7_ANGAN
MLPKKRFVLTKDALLDVMNMQGSIRARGHTPFPQFRD